uniref:Uncharacterized protein n=1 Tax=Salix viminalis TaxID=40686 RepID=A0A6N2K6G2_SALVM
MDGSLNDERGWARWDTLFISEEIGRINFGLNANQPVEVVLEILQTPNACLFIIRDERGGMLCSFLKRLVGSTLVFTDTNLSKLLSKYLIPQILACLKLVLP